MGEPQLIFVISDATGETAEKVVRAALLQFTNIPVQLRIPHTRDAHKVGLRGPMGVAPVPLLRQRADETTQ